MQLLPGFHERLGWGEASHHVKGPTPPETTLPGRSGVREQVDIFSCAYPHRNPLKVTSHVSKAILDLPAMNHCLNSIEPHGAEESPS